MDHRHQYRVFAIAHGVAVVAMTPGCHRENASDFTRPDNLRNFAVGIGVPQYVPGKDERAGFGLRKRARVAGRHCHWLFHKHRDSKA